MKKRGRTKEELAENASKRFQRKCSSKQHNQASLNHQITLPSTYTIQTRLRTKLSLQASTLQNANPHHPKPTQNKKQKPSTPQEKHINLSHFLQNLSAPNYLHFINFSEKTLTQNLPTSSFPEEQYPICCLYLYTPRTGAACKHKLPMLTIKSKPLWYFSSIQLYYYVFMVGGSDYPTTARAKSLFYFNTLSLKFGKKADMCLSRTVPVLASAFFRGMWGFGGGKEGKEGKEGMGVCEGNGSPFLRKSYSSGGFLNWSERSLCVKKEFELRSKGNESRSKLKKRQRWVVKEIYDEVLLKKEWLYVIAGVNNREQRMRECEKYSIFKDKWYRIPNINKSKDDVSASNFKNAFLYIFCGLQFRKNSSKSHSVERISIPNELSWENVSIIIDDGWNDKVGSCCLQISSNSILVFGGWKMETIESNSSEEEDTSDSGSPTTSEKKKKINQSMETFMFHPKEKIVENIKSPMIEEECFCNQQAHFDKKGQKVYVFGFKMDLHIFDIQRKQWKVEESGNFFFQEDENQIIEDYDSSSLFDILENYH
jgi:hypothetical protein